MDNHFLVLLKSSFLIILLHKYILWLFYLPDLLHEGSFFIVELTFIIVHPWFVSWAHYVGQGLNPSATHHLAVINSHKQCQIHFVLRRNVQQCLGTVVSTCQVEGCCLYFATYGCHSDRISLEALLGIVGSCECVCIELFLNMLPLL